MTIGNTLKIMLRQKKGSEQSWVSINQGDPFLVEIAPNEYTAFGEYKIILESYDDNGTVKSALKTDIITVTVPVPTTATVPVPATATESCTIYASQSLSIQGLVDGMPVELSAYVDKEGSTV